MLRLTVTDARSVRDRMVGEGAEEVVPIEDRPYGRSEGRIRDPFEHLWMVSHVIEDLPERRSFGASTTPTPSCDAKAGFRSV